MSMRGGAGKLGFIYSHTGGKLAIEDSIQSFIDTSLNFSV
jgi:hypothetical protein